MQQRPIVANCFQSNGVQWYRVQAGWVRVFVAAAGGFLMVIPLLFMLTIGASAADSKHSTPPSALAPEVDSLEFAPEAAFEAGPESGPEAAAADCATMANVPVAECLALVELYTQTHGTGWISRTHWLDFGAGAPCGWYGVVCDGGHVRRLLLAGNQLSGTLPLSLGNLTGLRRLRLENNALIGRVPPPLCALSELETLGLRYNALFTLRRSVEECLTALESEWAASQTVGVTKLRVTAIETDTLLLGWTPISYTEDGGYYEIGIATNPNGPFTLHGTTPDKVTASYAVTGLLSGESYFVRVRTFTPAHDEQLNDLYSFAAQTLAATRAESGRVLVAAYFPADNDLASEIPYVIERIRRGTLNNPNVQVVLLVDGRLDGDTSVIEIANGEIEGTAVVTDHWGKAELDTADPAVLAWFLQHARTAFPSEREVAAIIGHGIALAPEVEWPQAAQGVVASAGNLPADVSHLLGGAIPPLPKEHDYSPSDVTNRGYMSAVDVGEALMIATGNGANPFDLIFFDQCFQGSLDTLYEVRNSAHIYVASPNYAWLVAAYDRYLPRFTPTSTPEQMAMAVVNFYEGALNPHHPNAIMGITNSDLLAIAAKVNLLADALLAAGQANEQEKIAAATQQSQYVDTTQCGERNLQLGPPDELIGLESFAAALQAEFGAGDPYGVESAVQGLQPLMSNILKRSIVGNPYLAPNESWEYVNSLTVLAPLPRNSPSNVAWRASIYHANTPFAATWSVDPSQPVSVTESFAFVRDGRWDDFLAAWYVGLEPTVGQWCNYAPPPQVTVSETEQLTLTVIFVSPGIVAPAIVAPSAVTSSSLHLEWTPTDDRSATEYWLYVLDPYAVSWLVDQVVPLNEVERTLSELDAGDYRFKVVARNEEMETIAQSNEVSVTLTAAPAEETFMLLPFVTRDGAGR